MCPDRAPLGTCKIFDQRLRLRGVLEQHRNIARTLNGATVSAVSRWCREIEEVVARGLTWIGGARRTSGCGRPCRGLDPVALYLPAPKVALPNQRPLPPRSGLPGKPISTTRPIVCESCLVTA